MSLKTDILNILGHDSASTYISDDIDEYTIIEQAIWEAANLLPKKLFLMSNNILGNDPENVPDDPGGDNYDISGLSQSNSTISADKLILLVERVKSENLEPVPTADITVEKYDYKHCKAVSQTEKDKVLDAESIYYATNYSPVYWLEYDHNATSTDANDRKIFTAPVTTPSLYQNGGKNWLKVNTFALKIHVYSRQTGLTDSTTSYVGIPTLAKSFVNKVCALKLLDIKLASQSTSEEDAELFQLLNVQKQTFEKDLKEELGMLREMYK